MVLFKNEILLLKLLRDHFLFLARSQIERVLTLDRKNTLIAASSTRIANRRLSLLVEHGFLVRKYRVENYESFQTPLYFLGKKGWQLCGKAAEEYREYEARVRNRKPSGIPHLLAIYDVILKFILEGDVRRWIDGESDFWQEAFLENIPDGWIQFREGEAFLEIDRGTERESVVKKKIDNYVAFKHSGKYEHLFPNCTFKVLVFCPNEERIEALERITTTDDVWYCVLEEFLREPLSHEHWFALQGFYALSDLRKKEMPDVR